MKDWGHVTFPAAIRSAPAYRAAWLADPALKDFVARRRAAILGRRMAGFLPGGTKVGRAGT